MKTRGRTSCLLVERHAKTTWQTDDAFFLLIFSASPVLSKCSPAWQRNTLRLPLSPRPQKHPYRAPAKEARGPFTSARSTLWNPLDSKGLWTSSSSCKAVSLNRTNHGWRVFPLFIHITARCDLIRLQDITSIHSKTLVLREVSCYFLASVDDKCCMIVRCVEHAQTKHLFVPNSVMWEERSFQVCNEVLLFVRYYFQ